MNKATLGCGMGAKNLFGQCALHKSAASAIVCQNILWSGWRG
jgi:hypothetical protein